MRPWRLPTRILAAAKAALLLAAGVFSLAHAPPGSAESAPGLRPGTLGRLLTAEFAARRGGEADVARAVESYADAARAHRAPRLAERAARIAALANRFRLAAGAAGLWLELDPENRGARRIHALMLVRSDQAEEAAGALRGIARDWDEPPGAGHDVVVELLALEPDRGRRVRIMEAVADAGPEARFALARVLAAAGEVERGRQILEVLRRQAPAEDRYTVAHARLLHRHGDREAAIRVLADRRAQGDDGVGVEVLRAHARLLAAAERREEARSGYDALLARRPDDDRARAELGRLLAEMGHFRDARTHFEKLRHRPAWREEAWYFIGRIDESREEPERALRAYRRVREGPYYLTARIRAAVILADTDGLEQARRHLAATPRFTRADDARLYRVESDLLVGADRPGEAMALLDAALDAYPAQADLLYARAMVAEELDRLDILERDLRSIIGRDPNHADALNALGYTLADRTDRLEEAHALLERALALKPDEYHIVDSMGWVLYRMGRYEEAAEHLHRSYAMEPHPEVAAHLGEVLWALGRRDEARAIWNAALQEDPDDEVLVETIERLGS